MMVLLLLGCMTMRDQGWAGCTAGTAWSGGIARSLPARIWNFTMVSRALIYGMGCRICWICVDVCGCVDIV
jgi:hypothetical protein